MGETAQGGINFAAPIFTANGLKTIPYFVVMNANGQVTHRGNTARDVLKIQRSPYQE
jgi:hypothetical protein